MRRGARGDHQHSGGPPRSPICPPFAHVPPPTADAHPVRPPARAAARPPRRRAAPGRGRLRALAPLSTDRRRGAARRVPRRDHRARRRRRRVAHAARRARRARARPARPPRRRRPAADAGRPREARSSSARRRRSAIAALASRRALAAVGPEGYVIRARACRREARRSSSPPTRDVGVALRRVRACCAQLQTRAARSPRSRSPTRPKIQLRMLDHWDNLDGTVERGYAGSRSGTGTSCPDDLARATRTTRAPTRRSASTARCSPTSTRTRRSSRRSISRRSRRWPTCFRPYGIRVYLTARFSAPIELGGLKTADPLDPAVRQWWKAKVDEIYRTIPDFGGFLVKANSEGQPGPQDYKRTHADGANMLADALAPHGGVVMWRAFVYSDDVADRSRASRRTTSSCRSTASSATNVLVQVKNGPLDFQPREPFHPLFGAMPKTPLMLELQITQGVPRPGHAPRLPRRRCSRKCCDADTYAQGQGLDGREGRRRLAARLRAHRHRRRRRTSAAIATGRGSHFNQANWYAFGRLAWDPDAVRRGRSPTTGCA